MKEQQQKSQAWGGFQPLCNPQAIQGGFSAGDPRPVENIG